MEDLFTFEGGFGTLCELSAVEVDVGSDGVEVVDEEGVLAGLLPSLGLSAGAARESGWASFRSLKCLISKRLSPLLYEPTSIFTVDLEGRLSILNGPSQGVCKPVALCCLV